MTKIQLISGTQVFTKLSASSVARYLNKGNKTGYIEGYKTEAATESIIIAVQAIEFVYGTI